MCGNGNIKTQIREAIYIAMPMRFVAIKSMRVTEKLDYRRTDKRDITVIYDIDPMAKYVCLIRVRCIVMYWY